MCDANESDAVAPAAVEFGAEAYLSRAYAEAEPDRLWRKVWQAVCRVEELPEIGDYLVYDIADDSLIVTRSAADRFSAFYNVCAHRGRRLATGSGHARQFRCFYHAWCYDLTGHNVFVLDEADWHGTLSQRRRDLPAVRLELWGGFVWINMDPECAPLRTYLAPLAPLLDMFQFERMRYRWRRRGVFDCNWKVALEAFMEAYHVEGTHPQLLSYADFYSWSKADGLHSHKGFREKQPERNTPESNSYFRPGKGPDIRVAIARMQRQIWDTVNASTTEIFVKAAERLVDELPAEASADEITRHWLAAARRDDAARGVDWPEIAPERLAEAGNSCHLFPNLAIAYGFTFALCYRARPYGTDPNKCIFEGFVLERFPPGGAPRTGWIEADAVTGRDAWPPVLLQDFDNMAAVQSGMRSRGFRGNAPNPVQEAAISNFHANLARFMQAGAPHPLARDF